MAASLITPSAAPRRPLRPRTLLLAAGGALLTVLAVRHLPSPPPLEEATLGFAWPEIRQATVLTDPERLAELSRALARARRSPGLLPDHLSYWRLSWRRAGPLRAEILVTRDLAAWDPGTRTRLTETRPPQAPGFSHGDKAAGFRF